MTVYFENETGHNFAFDMESQLGEIISFVKGYVGCPYEVEVSVTMVDKPVIQEVNAQFRDIDKPTDVLSFPMAEYDEPADFDGEAFAATKSLSPDTGELVLGDIMLCAEVIKEQAEEYGHSEQREFSFLVVHSMLHLFGYDHMQDDERAEMEAEQKNIMNQLGIYR